MNNILLDDIINILKEEENIYNNILNISKNKTKIIIDGKVSELDIIVKQEQALILKIAQLENQREEIVKKVCQLENINFNQINISEIYKKMDDDYKKKFQSCQDVMVNIMKELKNVNETNSKLIKSSLEYIDFSLNILSSADAGVNNYGDQGIINNSKKRTFFDVKL